jgi:hypothetical protein
MPERTYVMLKTTTGDSSNFLLVSENQATGKVKTIMAVNTFKSVANQRGDSPG